MNAQKCVLIVDDNATLRRSLCRLFQSSGWKVCGEADDGIQAVSKAQELLPALVILDLAMPGMNGLTAAKIIKESNPGLHLILFTMYGDVITTQQLHLAGISALVSKSNPTAPSDLLRQAELLLNQTAA